MVNNINYEVEYVMNGIIQVEEVEAEVNNLWDLPILHTLQKNYIFTSMQNLFKVFTSVVVQQLQNSPF